MKITESIAEVEAIYPGSDAEWLWEDYRMYWSRFEDDQDCGRIGPDEQMLTFHAWLDRQPVDYLDAHGVRHGLGAQR